MSMGRGRPPEPRRVLINYGDFEIEVVVRPRARGPGPEPGGRPEEAGETARDRRAAVILDQMFRIGSVLEPLVPEGVVLYEVVGLGLEEEVRVSDKLVQAPARDDFDIYRLVERLSGQFGRVLLITGDKKLANAVRVQAARKGLANVEVHYMPPSEFPGRTQMIEAILRRIEGR